MKALKDLSLLERTVIKLNGIEILVDDRNREIKQLKDRIAKASEQHCPTSTGQFDVGETCFSCWCSWPCKTSLILSGKH